MLDHSYENELNLNVSENVLSYERISTRTHFENAAKGNSEMAYSSKNPSLLHFFVFPFKFLQQSPVSAGTRSPPHIRFDYFFPLGLRARNRTGHKMERFFIWKKFLLVTILKKKIEPLIADLWKQCTQRNTDSHIKRGNEKHKIKHLNVTRQNYSKSPKSPNRNKK